MLFFYYSLILLVLYYFSMYSNGRYRNSASSYQFRARPGYASGSFAPKNARRYTKAAGTAATRRYGTARKPAFKPKFAVISYSRDVEKKYLDRALRVLFAAANATSDTPTSDPVDGIMFKALSYRSYSFSGIAEASAVNITNNLLRAMAQGNTVNDRIGQKVTGKYIKGAMTLTAAKHSVAITGASNMYGEALISETEDPQFQYLRTTWRVAIVRDNQINGTGLDVTWDAVFQLGTKAVDGQDGNVGGVHSELNINNMGRFTVLQDRFFDLDADDPQTTWRYTIPGSQIGQVRYNGPDTNSVSDKGIYVVCAAYVNGVRQAVTTSISAPTLTMHSRFCFTDA